MNFLPLTTARLVLSAPRDEDCADLLRYQTRNAEHFAASSPLRDAAWFSDEACRGRIAKQLEEWHSGAGAHWLIWRDGALVGHASITVIVRGVFQAAYLGYGIDAACCAQGLASEALTAVVEHAFGPLNLHRLMASHSLDNAASERVLGKLGFVKEGVARDYLNLNGGWQDQVLTALTNDAWRNE